MTQALMVAAERDKNTKNHKIRLAKPRSGVAV